MILSGSRARLPENARRFARAVGSAHGTRGVAAAVLSLGAIISTPTVAHARVPPPVADGMPSVKLPTPRQATLDNGLRVLVVERYSDVPTFTAQLVLTDGGGLYEPPHRRGVAAFTANLLREGTATRSSQQIARQLETLGATLEADAPLAAATGTVTVTGLAVNLDEILELFGDVVRHPAFAERDVAQYASRTASELELRRARPEFLAQEQLQRAIYGGHPAALVAPPVASISATRREDLQRFHATHYRPNGALLVVIGAVTLDEVMTSVRRVFSDWQRREVAIAAISPVPKPQARAVRLIDRPGSVQTVIQLGVLGIARTDPDYFALQVLNEIVGGQSSARLYQNLRQRHGYTYGAYSGFSAARIAGVWQVNTPVRTEVTEGALEQIMVELRRIRDERVTSGELAGVQRSLIGKYTFALERPDRLLDNIVTQALYEFSADYWDTYIDRIAAVSMADVQRTAQRLVDLDHLQISAVGDGAKIRATLARFGPLRPAEDAMRPPPHDPTAATGAPIFSAQEHQRLAETIGAIADELIEKAIPKSRGIAWASHAEDGASLETLNIYDGSPGIAYFLLKAYQSLDQERYLVAARRALDYIQSQSKQDRRGTYFEDEANGVFEGNAGPGYLFLYAYHVTGEKGYLETAEAIGRRILATPQVQPTSNPDIIAGAAGTGLYLLGMHRVTKKKEYLRGARRLGDFLLDVAEPRGAGVTWKLTAPPDGKQPEYYFVGFSHGPAGIAYYLDRLHEASGDARYGAMALRAMAHIEAIAERESGFAKWYHEELKRKTRYSSQWCHGAPGMNAFFLERYARTAEPKYLQWASDSTEYLLDQGVNVRENASVCHGISGNTASLYLMYRQGANPDYLITLRAAVDLLYNSRDVGPNGFWNPGKGIDYSYMTGLAGVGDFFVLLHSEGRLNMFGPLGYGEDLAAATREAARRCSASARTAGYSSPTSSRAPDFIPRR